MPSINRRGERYLTVGQFISHASAVKVKRLTERELEFYERHCLLLPVARTHIPVHHAVALLEEGFGDGARHPEDLEPPDEWQRLNRGHEDGMHAFDRERPNSFLVVPDCTTFQPWDGDRVAVTRSDGRRRQRPRITRYYAAWQVHVVELLRRRFYERARFLNTLSESHDLRELWQLLEDTDEIRTLRGMAAGYEALTLFGLAARVAVGDAYSCVPAGHELSKSASSELQRVLAHRARRALDSTGVDESAFFDFVGKLTELARTYRAEERVTLADDTEQDLWDTVNFAYLGFNLNWDEFLTAAESYLGGHRAATLRRLDPVEAAAHEARENLASILAEDLGTSLSPLGGDEPDTPREIVEFCLEHDLFEVLYGLQNYSYTESDLRHDNYPGFLHRRLRPLALAAEQLARGILYTTQEPPYGEGFRGLIKFIGAGFPWLGHFEELIGEGVTSDKQGNLDHKAFALARSIQTFQGDEDKVVSTTLVTAVATRNLVSHRHKYLTREEVLTLGGVCANSIILIWHLAKVRGLV